MSFKEKALQLFAKQEIIHRKAELDLESRAAIVVDNVLEELERLISDRPEGSDIKVNGHVLQIELTDECFNAAENKFRALQHFKMAHTEIPNGQADFNYAILKVFKQKLPHADYTIVSTANGLIHTFHIDYEDISKLTHDTPSTRAEFITTSLDLISQKREEIDQEKIRLATWAKEFLDKVEVEIYQALKDGREFLAAEEADPPKRKAGSTKRYDLEINYDKLILTIGSTLTKKYPSLKECIEKMDGCGSFSSTSDTEENRAVLLEWNRRYLRSRITHCDSGDNIRVSIYIDDLLHKTEKDTAKIAQSLTKSADTPTDQDEYDRDYPLNNSFSGSITSLDGNSSDWFS